MKRNLLSELRTLYETSETYPHSLRVTMTMKDMIDGEILKQAVSLTFKRYPYFLIRLVREGEKLYFEDNPKELVVRHGYDVVTLSSKESNDHLIAISWWKNKIHFDAHHSFADGGAMGPLFKTLLYYYCSAFYEKELDRHGVQLADSPIDEREWYDPYRNELPPESSLGIKKWFHKALQISDTPGIHIKNRAISYNIRIPEESFLRFNLSKEGSPGTIIALFLARTIDAVCSAHLTKETEYSRNPIVIAMCVNQRKALVAPYAHNSLVGGVSLVYGDSMKTMDFERQVVCFRGMVSLQSDSDSVLEEVRDYKEFIDSVENIPTIRKRRDYCHQKMLERSTSYTATISYVGKSDFGEAEKYIQQFDVLPSAALPSIETPITIEVSSMNKMFFVNFIQNFEEDFFFNQFVRQLRENGIDYTVNDCEVARYPLLELSDNSTNIHF